MSAIDRPAVMFVVGLVGLAVAEGWTSFLIGWVISSAVMFLVITIAQAIRPRAENGHPEREA